jgi:hypothetical protein
MGLIKFSYVLKLFFTGEILFFFTLFTLSNNLNVLDARLDIPIRIITIALASVWTVIRLIKLINENKINQINLDIKEKELEIKKLELEKLKKEL